KIPAGALAYVGWAGQTPAFRGSTLGQFLDGQKTSNLLATAKSALKNEIPPRDHPTIDRLWSALEIALCRPAAMVLLDVRKDEKNPLDLLAVMDLGDQRDAFAGHLDAVLRAGVERKHWILEPASAGGLNYQQIRMDDKNAPAVAVGYAGSVFFLAVGQGVVEQFAALSPEKSLKADAAFQAARKDVATDKELLACCLDVAALTKKAKAMMPAAESAPDAPASEPAPDPVDTAMNVLGLAKVTTIAGSISAVDKNLLTQIRLVSPAPHKGLMTLLAGEPLGDDALAHVPADAHLAAAWRLSPEALYNELLEVAKAFHVRDGFDRDERRMQADLGLSVTQDILPALGDTWTLASAPSWGGAFTGTILTGSVKNPAKAALVTGKVEEFLSRMLMPPAPPADPAAMEDGMPAPVRRPRRGWSIEQRQVAGTTVKFVVRHGEAVPVAPAWAIHQGRLYVALWPQVIESAILRQAPVAADGVAKDPSLPATPAYLGLKQRVGK
ncbi:MAG: hypothetical protein NT031_13610, partial [Planctomycetota bacterium]|nr:hypothetical protein [Planctomycetota bacterium]